MIIWPYKTRRPRYRIIFVDSEGTYYEEDGSVVKPRWLVEDKHVRCFCAWETARRMTAEGHGEGLLWNGEHIRWRPHKYLSEREWHPRNFDAYVLRIPMHETAEENSRELARWRDWLLSNNATPGTLGGSSMSLLKSRINRRLVCSRNWDKASLPQSAGGRIVLGPRGPGTYLGNITHWDMPAAYASEIGAMRYGGRWYPALNKSPEELGRLVNLGVPVYARARVYIPASLAYGPLCRRYRKPLHPFMAQLMQASGERYPVKTKLQGIWTWEELDGAIRHGCSARVLEAWYHAAPKKSPFSRWWEAVLEGREMQGMAGTLAKTTGNALWGQFACDPATRGRRTILARDSKGKWHKRHPTKVPRPVPAIELAEIVAGRTRARMYDAIMETGDNLLLAHTDGLWAVGDAPSGVWRDKKQASQVDVLTPQNLRYYFRGRPEYIYSGVPAEQAEKSFRKAWEVYIESIAARAA